MLVTHEQMPFLAVSHKNTLFKTQSTRLHLIVNPSKGLKCTMSFLRNNPKISKNILLDLLNEKLGSQNPLDPKTSPMTQIQKLQQTKK